MVSNCFSQYTRNALRVASVGGALVDITIWVFQLPLDGTQRRWMMGKLICQKTCCWISSSKSGWTLWKWCFWMGEWMNMDVSRFHKINAQSIPSNTSRTSKTRMPDRRTGKSLKKIFIWFDVTSPPTEHALLYLKELLTEAHGPHFLFGSSIDLKQKRRSLS